ncbi:hypothetical protein [Bradyrhizobium guangxiense]|uniref:hypothetical protein n=1 Tax=Bradyrhizobium guangxiense TaxID=1325115 RepID=UPI001FE20146|nr:hypothetical protein [Bradyrhizobium guangxiense]
MVELTHEIWVQVDDSGQQLPSCCLAGPHGDDFRKLLGPGARLIHTFKAGSHYEAMTIYYRFLRQGPYTTEHPWDMQPYPRHWVERGRYAAKIILHSPLGNPGQLESFVEACLADGVRLIAVVGDDAENVEELIDEIVVGDGSDERRFIATTSHRNESLEEVLNFASLYDAGHRAQVEQVRF